MTSFKFLRLKILSEPANSASPGPLFATRFRYSRTGVSDRSQLVRPTDPRNGEVVKALQIFRINKILIFNRSNWPIEVTFKANGQVLPQWRVNGKFEKFITHFLKGQMGFH